jgi:hypothetical protein
MSAGRRVDCLFLSFLFFFSAATTGTFIIPILPERELPAGRQSELDQPFGYPGNSCIPSSEAGVAHFLPIHRLLRGWVLSLRQE